MLTINTASITIRPTPNQADEMHATFTALARRYQKQGMSDNMKRMTLAMKEYAEKGKTFAHGIASARLPRTAHYYFLAAARLMDAIEIVLEAGNLHEEGEL